jgi:transcriptional regulator with XRE-family HTH domain
MTIQIDPNEQVILALIEETQIKLGRVVKRNRQVLDLTQCDLGARAGVHQTCISGFEKHGHMTFDLFIRAAHALGVRPSELLQAIEDRDPCNDDDVLQGAHKLERSKRSLD